MEAKEARETGQNGKGAKNIQFILKTTTYSR
jgi:hypothetical protein